MPIISFIHGAPDRLAAACRLVQDCFREGQRVLVYAPDAELAEQFDVQLWTFSALGFVPHCRSGAALAAETPVLISPRDDIRDHDDVLVNLSSEVPPGFERFRRIIEVVSNGDDAGPARQRFRIYKDRGFPPDAQPYGAN